MRRIALFVTLMVVLGAIAGTATMVLLATALGAASTSPVGWIAVGAVFLAAVLGIFGGVRRLSLYARPARELIDATQRIEAGDYSLRMSERGPREAVRAARAFNQMSARLEAAEAQRRSVLADVAHELRTPLSIIRGQAEGIADGVYPVDAAHVAPILEAARTMEALVEDLRTMVLTDARALTLAREEVDLAVLVNETVVAFAGSAEAGGVRLQTDLPSDLPTVDADPARLRSVIGNLLSNAIHHTPAGGLVTITGARAADGVEVTVQDTGEGIPEDLAPRVFERFVRGPTSSGSGLGLAITKDLVEAHGGTVTLESTAGAGTTVLIRLPGRLI